MPYEKVGKNEPVCIADEVPFEIPDSWEWIRFKDLVEYSMGKTPPRKESEYWDNASIPWVSIADMVADGSVKTTKEMVNEFAAEHTFKRKISKAGTLLMSFKLTVGKVSILEIDAFHNEAIISIYPYVDPDKIITLFLFAVLPLLSQNGNTKTAIKGNTLNSNSLDELFIPLPPLQEQKRICKKLQALASPLARYESAERKANGLVTQFPDRLKKSILQQAVQGELVPQDLNDEPASVLLERIRAEKEQLIKDGKIKREKHESIIYRRDNSHYENVDGVERCIGDEIPFEIPESWEWTRIRNLCISIVDCPHSTPHYYSEDTGYYSIDTTCIDQDGNILGFRYVDEQSWNERIARLIPKKYDIVYTREGSIGRAAILPPKDHMCLGQRVMLLRFTELTKVGLYQQILMSPVVLDAIAGKTRGIGAKHINVSDVCDALVPVPPINEQIRIIDRLSHLIPKISMI